MRLIYGTGNPAKLQTMAETLLPLSLEIVGIAEVLDTLPKIDESGNDPLENAVIKATAYYAALRAPVFSCDSGLFIEELEPARQPGVHVRTINGQTLSDAEMTAHYAAIAKACGGACHAAYRNAICLMYDADHIYKYMGDDISGERFILSANPHPRRRPGFPLDSLSIDIDSGQYFYDLDQPPVSSVGAGFQRFFRSVLADLGKR